MKILHVIDRLTGAGPTRGVILLAKQQRQMEMGNQHSVVSLSRECYPLALVRAAQAGIAISRQPDAAALREQVESADIVQVSFWNNPALYRFLRSEWPAARLLLWLTVLGEHAPQVVPPALVDLADFAASTSLRTMHRPELDSTKMQWVPAAFDGDRLQGLVRRRPHEGFQVAYIGTTNFGKMHPGFISMSARAEIPAVRFVVCGSGGNEVLQREAEESGAQEKFQLRGFVEDIKHVLETADVFGYPLCEETYATSEQSLQEAMYAGVPPVVFPHGGLRDLVRNGETGLVVRTELEYTQALEYLFRHPDERERLGENARLFAEAHFCPGGPARAMDQIYRQMMESPKRERRWPGAAHPFVAALGSAAPEFGVSLTGPDAEAERKIAHSPAALVSGEGGIFQYRNAFPDDPYLRFWAGLALLKQERFPVAFLEMQAAMRLGLDGARVEQYAAAAESGIPIF